MCISKIIETTAFVWFDADCGNLEIKFCALAWKFRVPIKVVVYSVCSLRFV